MTSGADVVAANGGRARPGATTDGALVAIATISSIGLLPWLNKSLWEDEGASLYAAHLSWRGLWQQSRVVDLVLLPYYAVLHVWVQVSGGIGWIRFLSILAFGLTVFVTGRLGNRLGGRWCAVVAAVLTATNPLMVEAALDARPYALAALAASVSVTALIRWFDSARARWMWVFSLCALAALLLQMFAVLVPVSALVVLLLIEPHRWREQSRRLLPPLTVLTVAAVAFGVVASGQSSQIAWITPLQNKGLIIALLGPEYAIGEHAYAVVALGIVALVAAAALVVCVRAWRGGRRPTRPELGLFVLTAAWAAIPTAVLIAFSLVKPVYTSRYVTPSAPGLALVVGLLVAHSMRIVDLRWRTRSLTVIGAGVGVATLVVATLAVPAAGSVIDDLQGAAQFLAVHVRGAGDVAITDHAMTAAIDYYFQKDHAKVAAWPQLPDQRYISGFDLEQNAATVSRAPATVWLVDNSGIAGTGQFIALLRRHGYARAGTRNFVGCSVVRFYRRTT